MSEPNQQPTPPTEPRLPWRKLIDRNSEDFTVDDMPDDPRDPAKKLDLTVRIERVDQFAKVKSVQNGRTKETKCPKLYFAGIPKPLAVKVTLAKQITTVLGSKYPIDWQGQLITLTVMYDEMCFGTPTDVVRVLQRRATEEDWKRCQKGYKPPPFNLEMALKSFADARTTDEIKTIRVNMRVPAEHKETVLKAWETAHAALVAAEKGEQPYDPDAEGDAL